MQVDSVGTQSYYAVQPGNNGTTQGEESEETQSSSDAATDSTGTATDSTPLPSENPEYSAYSASSSIKQERYVNPTPLTIDEPTLQQLIAAGAPKIEKLFDVATTKTSESSEEKAESVDENPKPTEEEEPVLPGDTQLKVALVAKYNRKTERKQNALIDAWRGSWYEAVAKESVGDMLESINALLKDAKLTKEQFEALVIFNETANRLTQNFAVPDIHHDFGVSREETLAELQSAFDVLANSFSSVMQPTPKVKQDLNSLFAVKIDHLQNALENTVITKENVTKMVKGWTETDSFEKLMSSEIDQLLVALGTDTVKIPDLTKEDIAEIVDGWAYTEEQKERVQELMPQFIEGLKTRLLGMGYSTQHL